MIITVDEYKDIKRITKALTDPETKAITDAVLAGSEELRKMTGRCFEPMQYTDNFASDEVANRDGIQLLDNYPLISIDQVDGTNIIPPVFDSSTILSTDRYYIRKAEAGTIQLLLAFTNMQIKYTAAIPFLKIHASNKTFSFNDGVARTAILTEGVYSVKEIADNLQTAIRATDATQDTTTVIYNISTHSFDITFETTATTATTGLASVIGYDTAQVTATAHTSDRSIPYVPQDLYHLAVEFTDLFFNITSFGFRKPSQSPDVLLSANGAQTLSSYTRDYL